MSDGTFRDMQKPLPDEWGGWRLRLYRVIFEHDTLPGRAFDIVLLVLIAFSVTAVCLESVAEVREQHGPSLNAAEWVFTGLFTVEYVLRLLCVRRPGRYATSFFGIVDLLALIPTYAGIYITGAEELLVIRALRMLRMFRVLKMGEYLSQAGILTTALKRSRPKITVFLMTVLTTVLIVGALMHLIEGPANGFTNIPVSVYWAIVTLTTVGYGDLAPKTGLGRMVASAVMITGYGIIAVPTGIVTAEIVRGERGEPQMKQSPRREAKCPVCDAAGHDADALHCKYCGGVL